MTAQTSENASTTESIFTAFWLFAKRREASIWRDAVESADRASETFIDAIEDAAPAVQLRAAYATAGLSPEVDLILWVTAQDPARLHDLAAALDRTYVGRALETRRVYFGTASSSQYDPNHGPAFMQGKPPKRYLSVYPFVKTPEWYLLPYEQRRDLMIEHGRMGHEFPSVLTNTVNSFGIADQEFIVALEDDDPAVLVKMVQRLRAAEVRKYTALDTPIYLGLRKDLDQAVQSLF